MSVIYNIAIIFYRFVIGIASLFNPKAKLWIEGRKGWKDELENFVANNVKPIVWVHAASLGEFEQGRPIIEDIKANHKGYSIVLTFFSPSGFEIRKNYDKADYICYLPLDTRANALNFISILKPEMAIIVKYEFWLNHLSVLREKDIAHYLVSGIFRESQVFFKNYGAIFRKGLNGFEEIFVQNDSSASLLRGIGYDKVITAGDTRFDRVLALKDKFMPLADIQLFKSNSKLIVVGSSWPKEEELLLNFIKANLDIDVKYISAPHEIDHSRIDSLVENSPLVSGKLSDIGSSDVSELQLLIVDSIGLLSKIYFYADISVIGGGYNAGIHNTLEAAVWGKPVVFGPKYHNFREAVELIKEGAAYEVRNPSEFNKTLLSLLNDDELRAKSGIKAGNYCRDNSGASRAIMQKLALNLND
jgi:3-deoxy-D-manno-octulosonic-acid transferase